jgi:hypothetical protein
MIQLMNHTANEIKVSVATATTYLWFVAREKHVNSAQPAVNGCEAGSTNNASDPTSARASGSILLPASYVKAVLPMLVNGTKEKNSLVKSSSEAALGAVLEVHLDGAEAVQQASH